MRAEELGATGGGKAGGAGRRVQQPGDGGGQRRGILLRHQQPGLPIPDQLDRPLRRVAWLGWRQDTGALLAGCDIFVCPSRHEPLGNVVLEAWSAAKPVVAAAAQGPVELIRQGETGLLVPKEDPAALAAAIAGLLDEPARAAGLAAAGRAEFARDHAAAPVLARWHDFLQAVEPR